LFFQLADHAGQAAMQREHLESEFAQDERCGRTAFAGPAGRFPPALFGVAVERSGMMLRSCTTGQGARIVAAS